MTQLELLERINWSQVGEAIRAKRGSGIMDLSVEDVCLRVAQVVGETLWRDLEGAMDVRVEERISYRPRPESLTRTGIVDLAVLRSDGWYLFDWKTLHGSKGFTPEHEERLRWDPAWVFYWMFWRGSVGPAVQNFCYRNVLFHEPLLVERNFRVTPTDIARVSEDLFRAEKQLLMDHDLVPWPRHLPDACTAFGSRCHRYDACRAGNEAPVFPLKYTISPSLIKTLRLCPERARWQLWVREDDTPDPDEGGERTILGTMFHAGIAEVYRQGWEVWKCQND